MMRPLIALAAIMLAPQGAVAQSCALAATDSLWVAKALEGWTRTAAREAGAMVRRPPVLVLFDTRCTHTLDPHGGTTGSAVVAGNLRFTVTSATHGDSIVLPNNTRVPAGLTSFAAPQPDGRMFFVMSLPSIWATSNRGPRPDLLATAVFMHEFTHTQTVALSARIDTLVARGLPEDSDDDVIQTRYEKRAGYKAAYELERDTLFAAVAAPTDSVARILAASAARAIDRRRARWYRGSDSLYADAEDLFLTLEGAGQWLAYRWLVDPRGGNMSPAEALPFMRRGGRRWSQDEGLALLLVVNRLSDTAAMALFRSRPRTILEMLRTVSPPARPKPALDSPGVLLLFERDGGITAGDSSKVSMSVEDGLHREQRAHVVVRNWALNPRVFEGAEYMLNLRAVSSSDSMIVLSLLVDIKTGAVHDRGSFRVARPEAAVAADSLGARVARVIAARRQLQQ